MRKRIYATKKERLKANKERYAERHPDRIKAYRKKYSALYREKNREKLLAYNHQYYAKNKDRLLSEMKKWKEKNRERLNNWTKKSRASDPERYRGYSRKSYYKNREAISKKRRQLRAEGYYARIRLLRRARLKGAGGKTSQELLLKKLIYYGFRCRYCSRELTKGILTFDHAIPICRGGTNWTANLLPSCATCNSMKGRKTFNEFITEN